MVAKTSPAKAYLILVDIIEYPRQWFAFRFTTTLSTYYQIEQNGVRQIRWSRIALDGIKRNHQIESSRESHEV